MLPSNLTLLHKRHIVNAAAAGVSTTFDPSVTFDGAIVYSNGNLTITGGATAFDSTRSTVSKSSGKYYGEISIGAGTGSQCAIGFCNASEDGSDIGFSGGHTVRWNDNGTVYINSGSIGTAEAPGGSGNVLCWAIDIPNKLVWFRKNAGNWNNDAGADPAAGTGGFDLTTMSGFTLFVWAQVRVSGDAYTANFGNTAYTHTAPSGFGNFA